MNQHLDSGHCFASAWPRDLGSSLHFIYFGSMQGASVALISISGQSRPAMQLLVPFCPSSELQAAVPLAIERLCLNDLQDLQRLSHTVEELSGSKPHRRAIEMFWRQEQVHHGSHLAVVDPQHCQRHSLAPFVPFLRHSGFHSDDTGPPAAASDGSAFAQRARLIKDRENVVLHTWTLFAISSA